MTTPNIPNLPGMGNPPTLPAQLSTVTGRVLLYCDRAVEGLTVEQFCDTRGGITNSIGWDVWHVVRTIDNIIHFVFERQQPVAGAGGRDAHLRTAVGPDHKLVGVLAVRAVRRCVGERGIGGEVTRVPRRAVLQGNVDPFADGGAFGGDQDRRQRVRNRCGQRRLGREQGITVRTTFLGAHALPPEYTGRNQDYIDHLCQQMLPQLAEEGLVDAVDVFCERIAFTLRRG